jgi:hypothetical protein
MPASKSRPLQEKLNEQTRTNDDLNRRLQMLEQGRDKGNQPNLASTPGQPSTAFPPATPTTAAGAAQPASQTTAGAPAYRSPGNFCRYAGTTANCGATRYHPTRHQFTRNLPGPATEWRRERRGRKTLACK